MIPLLVISDLFSLKSFEPTTYIFEILYFGKTVGLGEINYGLATRAAEPPFVVGRHLFPVFMTRLG